MCDGVNGVDALNKIKSKKYDGFKDEFKGFSDEQKSVFMQLADTNSDGKISKQEMKKAANLYEKGDANFNSAFEKRVENKSMKPLESIPAQEIKLPEKKKLKLPAVVTEKKEQEIEPYEVKKGDNLYKIVKNHSEGLSEKEVMQKVKLLEKDNQEKQNIKNDKARIFVGQKLDLSALDKESKPQETKTETEKKVPVAESAHKKDTQKKADAPAAKAKAEEHKKADAPAEKAKTEAQKKTEAPAAKAKTEEPKKAEVPAAKAKTEEPKKAEVPAAKAKTEAAKAETEAQKKEAEKKDPKTEKGKSQIPGTEFHAGEKVYTDKKTGATVKRYHFYDPKVLDEYGAKDVKVYETYDPKTNTISKKSIYADNSLRTVDEYDKKGNRVQLTHYHDDKISDVLNYDPKSGKDVKLTIYKEDGKTIDFVVRYNKQGEKLDKTYFKPDGKTVKKVEKSGTAKTEGTEKKDATPETKAPVVENAQKKVTEKPATQSAEYLKLKKEHDNLKRSIENSNYMFDFIKDYDLKKLKEKENELKAIESGKINPSLKNKSKTYFDKKTNSEVHEKYDGNGKLHWSEKVDPKTKNQVSEAYYYNDGKTVHNVYEYNPKTGERRKYTEYDEKGQVIGSKKFAEEKKKTEQSNSTKTISKASLKKTPTKEEIKHFTSTNHEYLKLKKERDNLKASINNSKYMFDFIKKYDLEALKEKDAELNALIRKNLY